MLDLDITISKDCLTIWNSYTITNIRKMNKFLNKIRTLYVPPYNIPLSNEEMIAEWICHNICYKLHIVRDRTKTVDLDYNKNWFIKLFYKFLGLWVKLANI